MSCFLIHCNYSFPKEREYIYDVIFRDFWELDYKVCYEERSDVILELDDVQLHVNDSFFQQDDSAWLQERSLPKCPIMHKYVPDDFRDFVIATDIPVIYGDEDEAGVFSISRRYCSIDIFGSAFFMMTRYEELIIVERDSYGRFPANKSVAFRENFLHRPIINEYIELLWQWMKHFWPSLTRKERKFTIMPTHDCDNPFRALSITGWARARSLAGDIVKRHSFPLFLQNLKNFYEAEAKGDFSYDPHNTFSRIMDIDERNGLTGIFFFMTAEGRHYLDGKYDIQSPPVVRLAKELVARGHRIGLHPGFGSAEIFEWIQADTERLRQMLEKEKLEVIKLGGRQHYLYWKVPETWRYYEKAGLAYDTSLGFADWIGFRCGVCFDYPVYDIIERKTYKLREFPLEVMECSGLDYMKLSCDDMLEKCLEIKAMIKQYQGIFVVLWHNTRFILPEEVGVYERLLAE